MRYVGMSRIELYTWLGFLGFWSLMLPLALLMQKNESATWILAVLIVPLLLAWAAPQMFVYGLVGFICNLLTARWKPSIRIPATMGLIFIAASIVPPFLDRSDHDYVKSIKAGDVTGRPSPGATTIALLLASTSEHPSAGPASCNVLCQSLLYTGEAKTVLSGVTPNTLSSRLDPDTIPVIAYSIAHGTSCRAAGLSSSKEDNDYQPAFFGKAQSDIAVRSEAGECLQSRPGKLTEAGLVVLETTTVSENPDHNKRFNLRRIDVLERKANAWARVSRKTFAHFEQTSLPLLFWIKPGWTFELVRMGRSKEYEPYIPQTYLRKVVGLKLATASSPSTQTLRQVAEQTLREESAPRSLNSSERPDRDRIDDYLQDLSRRDATEEDIVLVRKIIRTQTLPTNTYWRLKAVIERMGKKSAAIAPDLIDELMSAYAVRAGRTEPLAGAFAALPKEVIAPYHPQLMILAQDWDAYPDTGAAITRLAYGPTEQAIKLFTPLIASQNSDERYVGDIGFCLMGERARPAANAILDRAVKGRSSNALDVAIWRLGLFEEFKARRQAMPRSSTEQKNDANMFRTFPMRMRRAAKRGDEEICRN